MRTPHTNTNKGKRVRIILRDGTVIIDKFVENTGHKIVLQNYHRPILTKELRAFSIYKPR